MAKQIEVVDGRPKSPIEILNLYYMFLYTWRCFEGAESDEVKLSDSTNLVNLFAKVLGNGVRRLLRRGLDRGYQEVIEETRSPRGRFLLAHSIKKASFLRSAAVCLFDELSPDLLHNQIIKATIRHLLDSNELDSILARDLSFLVRQLDQVCDIKLADEIFHRVKLTRNTRHYGLLLKICQILHEHLLVGEGTDKGSFQRLVNDKKTMHKIFQDFVVKFYTAEQSKFRVSSPQVIWDLTDPDDLHTSYMPNMYTDIVLQSSERNLIIDTKFYSRIMIGQGRPKVRSSHLYQVFTYLSQWHKSSGTGIRPDGMLLYAKTMDEDLDLTYVISDYRLRVKTLDLNQPWGNIHDSLLGLLS